MLNDRGPRQLKIALKQIYMHLRIFVILFVQTLCVFLGLSKTEILQTDTPSVA